MPSLRSLINWQQGLLGALMGSSAAKAVTALGSVVLVATIGRMYGASGVGVYAIAQSIIAIAGIVANCGMNGALLRFAGRNHRCVGVLTYLRWATIRCVAVSIAGAVLLFFGRHVLADLFNSEHLAPVLAGMSFALPPFAMATLLAGFMKGVRKPVLGTLLQNGLISLLAAVLLLLINWKFEGFGLAQLGYVYAAAAWAVLLWGISCLWHWYSTVTENTEQAFDPAPRKAFFESSNAWFFLALAGLMQTHLGMLIAGSLLTTTALGLYKAALQSAMLVRFIHMVINAVFPPRFAALYHEGDMSGLRRLVKQGAVAGAVLALPIVVVYVLVPGMFLSLVFGEEFRRAAKVLWIIAAAYYANVITGSVGYLLNVTGNEKLMRNIGIINNGIGLLLLVFLTYMFGVMGTALATAIMVINQSVLATWFAWRRLGIWPLPIPNVFHALGIQTKAQFSPDRIA